MSVADSPNLKQYSLKDLQRIASVPELAALLGYKSRTLSYIVYKLDDDLKYKTFEIPKRSGGKRTISAPIPEIKTIQQRVNDLMLDCLDEIDRDRGYRTNTSHGFERKRSIVTNALEHRNRRHVFNVDLQDFFGSVHRGRLIGLLVKDRAFALKPRIATVLSQIACFEDGLPQGSPCSPVFANIVARVLDAKLRKLASACKCTYTRYADDLTFSTNLKVFPAQIATVGDEENPQWRPGDELLAAVVKCGFQINEKKTRMQYRTSRQEVTGLVVNRKVNVPTEYRKDVRAMVHSLVTKGTFTRSVVTADANGVLTAEAKPGTLDQLQGLLGYINKVDTPSGKAKTNQPNTPIVSEAMYRKFLMYKWFYSAPMPTILCEGITDNIYLVHALRSRAAAFPSLVRKEADGSLKLDVRFFRYPKGDQRQTRSTGRILGLTGGSPCLGQFLLAYRDTIKDFHDLKNPNPVIVLLDNDQGAGSVFSILQQILGTPQSRDEEWIHVVGNVYVVATKRDGTKPSKIEDLFKDEVKKDLGGRKFSDLNDPNPITHYGKVEFATKIVRPEADSIDFSGFDPLLSTILKVKEHRKKFIET